MFTEIKITKTKKINNQKILFKVYLWKSKVYIKIVLENSNEI